ncbi:MAG TPA: NifU family protein [Candidatus Magasanikbacteria bacterium]|nr:NifU family protein [Candidatus Magasanikbacteria bacterium]
MNLREKIEKTLNDEIRPRLLAHGGGIDIISVDEISGRVEVSFQGACAGCPYADETFSGLVSEELRARVPEIRELVSNNSHDSDLT